MSDDNAVHERVALTLRQIIGEMRDAVGVSPTTIAVQAAEYFREGRDVEVHLFYGSIEHFKQMARRILRESYDPQQRAEMMISGQGDMFSELLQDRYPIKVPKGADPIYKRRDSMTVAELRFSVAALRRAGAALLKHADALEVYTDQREAAELEAA